MNAVGGKIVFEQIVTMENGRTVLQERRYSGLLDADGTFHLRAYRGKRFFIQKGSEGKVGNTAA